MKIIRTHYNSSEAAKILGCDEKDLFHLAFEKKAQLGVIFHEMFKKFEFTAKFYINSKLEFEKWLINSKAGIYNSRLVCGESYVEVISQDLLEDQNGFYFIGWLKAYWNCDYEYLVSYYERGSYPEKWPEYFYPDFNGETCCIIKVIPNYNDVIDNENYFFEENIYLTGSTVASLKETIFKSNHSTNKNLQSDVQKERHAVPRVEILMALVSLYHQGLNIRKENATQLTELLWKRSDEFWPDRKAPPLKFETVRDLISDALKGPVFNS